MSNTSRTRWSRNNDELFDCHELKNLLHTKRKRQATALRFTRNGVPRSNEGKTAHGKKIRDRVAALPESDQAPELR
jgi:hypothetical protein